MLRDQYAQVIVMALETFLPGIGAHVDRHSMDPFRAQDVTDSYK